MALFHSQTLRHMIRFFLYNKDIAFGLLNMVNFLIGKDQILMKENDY